MIGKQTLPAEATTFKFQQEVLEGLTDSEAFFNELALVHESSWVYPNGSDRNLDFLIDQKIGEGKKRISKSVD